LKQNLKAEVYLLYGSKIQMQPIFNPFKCCTQLHPRSIFLLYPPKFCPSCIVLCSQLICNLGDVPGPFIDILDPHISCRHLHHILLPAARFSPPILSMLHLSLNSVLLSPHRPPSMIISQPRDPTRRLHPHQRCTIRLRNPYFVHLLLRLANICLWPLRTQRIPVPVILGWRCHLLF